MGCPLAEVPAGGLNERVSRLALITKRITDSEERTLFYGLWNNAETRLGLKL